MITIPCDTIVRLSNLLPRPGADVQPIFNTFRLDHGRIIATDRRFAAVEELQPFEGVYHIVLTPEMLQVCTNEAQYQSSLLITPNPMLKWTVARTSMGHTFQGSVGVYPAEPTPFDEWYELIVQPVLDGEPVSNGAMSTNATDLARLAASSPSGEVVFEQHIDVRRSTVMRDVNDPRWCGFWMPRLAGGMYHAPATVPGWCVQ